MQDLVRLTHDYALPTRPTRDLLQHFAGLHYRQSSIYFRLHHEVQFGGIEADVSAESALRVLPGHEHTLPAYVRLAAVFWQCKGRRAEHPDDNVGCRTGFKKHPAIEFRLVNERSSCPDDSLGVVQAAAPCPNRVLVLEHLDPISFLCTGPFDDYSGPLACLIVAVRSIHSGSLYSEVMYRLCTSFRPTPSRRSRPHRALCPSQWQPRHLIPTAGKWTASPTHGTTRMPRFATSSGPRLQLDVLRSSM